MRDRKRTVLVLDRDAASREAVRSFFEDAGWLVHAVRGSREALALVARARPDLIIVEPSRGARLLRSLDPALPPPLVLLSADRTLPSRAGELGVLGVLAKPVRLSGLLELHERIERAGHALV